jgi:hypothetical protein
LSGLDREFRHQNTVIFPNHTTCEVCKRGLDLRHLHSIPICAIPVRETPNKQKHDNGGGWYSAQQMQLSKAVLVRQFLFANLQSSLTPMVRGRAGVSMPLASTVEDFEAPLPWNVKATLPTSHLHALAQRKHAVI